MVPKKSLTFNKVKVDCEFLAEKIFNNTFKIGNPIKTIVAVTRGGLIPAGILAQRLNIRDVRNISIKSYNEETSGELELISESNIPDSPQTLFVDDLKDTGKTSLYLRKKFPNSLIAVVYKKTDKTKYNNIRDEAIDDKKYFDFCSNEFPLGTWLIFPWEYEKSLQQEWRDKQQEKKIILNNCEDLGNEYLSNADAKKLVSSFSLNANKIRINENTPYKSYQGIDLTKEQIRTINDIESSDDNLIMLTGKAGSGKSTIVKELMHRNPSGIRICSTTAKSAILVGGVTVDKLFGFNREANGIPDRSTFLQNIGEEVETIIIDEASMMGYKMFEECYRLALHHNKKFLLVGDWAQAAPIKDNWIFASKLFQEDVRQIKLTESHRQTNEAKYIEVLNKIRQGIVDDQVNEVFHSRDLEQEDIEDASFDELQEIGMDEAVFIFGTNVEVDNYNKRRLLEYSETNNQKTFTLNTYARDINKNVDSRKVQYYLSKSPFANKDDFCVGCRVLFTRNDPGMEYVNGDTGKIVSKESLDPHSFTYEEGGPSNEVIKVLLDRTGHIVEVRETTVDVRNARNQKELTLVGFPLSCGYAYTAHKAQGLTIPKVYVDINSIKKMHSHGLAYVALSRVRDLEDLYISKWDPECVRCDDIVKKYI